MGNGFTSTHASFVSLLLSASLLAACAAGEDYQKPDLNPPAAWVASVPQAEASQGITDWWAQLNDPVLLSLVKQSQLQNPSLEEAVARIDKSRATLRSARASYYPDVTAQGSGQRAKQNTGAGSSIGNTVSGTLDASWELDLFGKTQRTAEAAKASVEARVADWHNARVSLEAEVADTYVQYRSCQMLVENDRTALTSQQATEKATLAAQKAGLTATADAALISASVASATATLASQEADCGVLIKSLVALTGMPEDGLRTALDSQPAALPQAKAFAVASVPATMLNQRPDLVSLERQLAASSADIGAAEANRWPSLSLGASITSSGINLGSMLTSWLLSTTLNAPLIDGGERAAAVQGAQADYAYQLAAYKQGLRTAIKEVEQALVRLEKADTRRSNADKAAADYATYEKAAQMNWRAGGLSLLDFEQAHRNALNAQNTAITTQRDQIQYWIALYKAAGGGWKQGETATTPPHTGDAL